MRGNLIEARGKLNQTQVAKSLGITQQCLSSIELGKRNPSVKLMKKFETYYKKSMVELFEDIFLNTHTTKCSERKIKSA